MSSTSTSVFSIPDIYPDDLRRIRHGLQRQFDLVGIHPTRVNWTTTEMVTPSPRLPGTLPIIVPHLGDLAITFEFLWLMVKTGPLSSQRREHFRSDPGHLRNVLDPTGASFQPFTLRWEWIQLHTHPSRSATWMRQYAPSSLCGIELLAALVQWPQVFSTLPRDQHLSTQLCALEYNFPHDLPHDGNLWDSCPVISFNPGGPAHVDLGSRSQSFSGPRSFNPIIVTR